MAFAFAVIFAAANMDRGRAVEARDSVTCVKVEPEVADLEGCHFCNAQAADGSEGDEEPVAVIPEAIRAEAEHSGDQGAVNGEEGAWGRGGRMVCRASRQGSEFDAMSLAWLFVSI